MKIPMIALACVLLTGCAALRDTKSVTSADSGSEVTMAVGQTLVVKLPANRTTGSDWVDRSSGEIVLQLQGEPVYLWQSSPNGMVGVGGTELRSYRAMKAGTQTLQLAYGRPWETNFPPVNIVTYNVVVSEKAAK